MELSDEEVKRIIADREKKKKHAEYMKEYNQKPENKERVLEDRRNNYNKLSEEEHQRRKDVMKTYHANNKDKAKERREKNKAEFKEYMIEYRKTDEYKKSYRISNWKKSGVKCDDFNGLYDKYISVWNCEECNVELKEGNYKNKKCLDHDHETGVFRNIICNSCNVNRGNIDRQKEDYKEQVTADKNYRQSDKGKETIKARASRRYVCDCGEELTVGNKARHEKRQFHLNYIKEQN